MTMPPREIIDRLMRKKPAPRMGVSDSPWGDTLAKWVAEEGYPKDAAGNPVSPCDHFGFDLAGVGGWFDALPLRGFSETVEENDESRAVRNGAGAVLRWWKNKSGTPEHVDFLVQGEDGRWRLPDGSKGRLPLFFSLRATKPVSF